VTPEGRQLQAGIEGYLDGLGFSGSMLVRMDGLIVLQRGFRYADKGECRANQSSTAFQIASVSKQFAAATVLLLQERGVLSVDDWVSAWIPGCPPAWRNMTIHHLLTHTSGIGHYWGDFPEIDVYVPTPATALLRAIMDKPLKFAPGEGWHYSSPGYRLLAHIIERATGGAYAGVINRLIFEPVGMRHTWLGSTTADPQNCALGYKGGVRVPSVDLDAVSLGAGDGWSTTGDLDRWNRAVWAGGLLAPASTRAMFTAHAATSWSEAGVGEIRSGYGCFLTRVEGHRMIYHPGDTDGYACINAVFPDDRLHLVVLGNDEDLEPLPIAVSIARRLLSGGHE
jgi:CubicO group peptidase (beta-lactamase class C family)